MHAISAAKPSSPLPDLSDIMLKVAMLRPMQSIVYWRGPTCFMVGNPREKEWLDWVETMNREGWHDFTQRRVGMTASGVAVFEYIARHRVQRAKPVRW